MTAPVPGQRTAGQDAARAIEATIARLLVVGTYVAIGLTTVGVLGMLGAGVDPLGPGGPGFDPARLVGDILALRAEAFLWAGLIAVIALPIGRVIVGGVGFLAAGDRWLAAVSLAVLLVVLASIFAAIALEG